MEVEVEVEARLQVVVVVARYVENKWGLGWE